MENLGTFMNVLTDFGFKRMFGTEEFKPVLIRFLNVLFEPQNIKVLDVKFHNKEVLPPNPDGKRIVYDVYCTSKDEKEHFVLEMQQEHHKHFEKRMMYYMSKALALQGVRGEDYDYSPVYGIFFVDFQFKHLCKKLLHDFGMRERNTHELFSNLLNMIIVCLEEVKDTWEECNTELERMTFIIKNMHHMDKNSEAYKSKDYSDMFEAAEIGSFAAEDVVAYKQSVRAYEDRKLYFDSAYSDGYENGEAEGFAKGMEEGREEGREEGMEMGMEKGISIIAKKMLESGIDPNFILQITGLAPGEY